MIVAYDLRYASDHFAGIGRHAYALLATLLELPGDERYAVLWDPRERDTRHDLARIRTHPRVEWVERPWHFIHPWGAVQVGAWLRRLRPAVYLSPFSLRPIRSGRREIVTMHDVAGLRVAHTSSPLLRELFRLSQLHAARARGIVTVSEFSRREILATLPVRPERVRAIHVGVPEPAGRLPPARRPAGLAAGRFALVVGDNRPRKNLAVLARAWAQLGPRAGLALVGVGPVDERFPSLAQASAVLGAQSVEQLGWRAPEEIAWLYEHAELLLFPSTYEGFGAPILEAFAVGLPALLADIPVFREVAGEAARFVDPHDPAAWARAITDLAGDETARARLRAAGLARAAQLTYRATAEATLAFVREVAAAP